MIKMLTALEARQIAGETVEEKVASLLDSVKIAAEQKKRSLDTKYVHKLDSDLWNAVGDNDMKMDQQRAYDILTKLGYDVYMAHMEYDFSNEDYTVVSW